jgi:hypothetical protein
MLKQSLLLLDLSLLLLDLSYSSSIHCYFTALLDFLSSLMAHGDLVLDESDLVLLGTIRRVQVVFKLLGASPDGSLLADERVVDRICKPSFAHLLRRKDCD